MGNYQFFRTHLKSFAVYALLAAAALAPLIHLVSLVVTNYIGTPFADTWSVYYRIAKFMTGGSTLTEFLFPQYNEARPVVPRLILFLVHSVNRSLVIDVALNIGSAIGTAIATLLILRKINPKLSWAAVLAVSILFNLNFFSVAQWKNWIWHTQLMMFLPNLFFAIGWLINVSSLRPLWRGSLVSFCCALSTFSFANGLSQWALLVPLTGGLERKEKFRLWGLHAGAALICFVLYFTGYKSSKGHSLGAGLVHSGALATNLFTWLGSSLAGGSLPMARIWGVVLLLTFLVLVFLSWKAERLAIEYVPWLSMGAYALVSGLLVSLGRPHIGLQDALHPRYCTISQWLIIAIVGLSVTLLHQSWEHKPGLTQLGPTSFALFVAALLFFQGRHEAYAVQQWAQFTESMHFQTQSFGLEKAEPGQLWTFEHPNKHYVWGSYQLMLKAGFLRDFYRSSRILPLLAKHQTGDPHGGELELAAYLPSRQIVCKGWSVGGYPTAGNRVLIVLITPGTSKVLAVADGPIDRYRFDTWKTKEPSSRKVAGFDLRFPVPKMDPGEYLLAAFRYDRNEQSYYAIGAPVALEISR